MIIWLEMILGGLITFGMRFSLIYLFGKHPIPEAMRRALQYVPLSVLSAIIVPSLLIRSNALDLSLGNTYLIAGIVAAAVSWTTKNVLLTIITGMVIVLLTQFL